VAAGGVSANPVPTAGLSSEGPSPLAVLVISAIGAAVTVGLLRLLRPKTSVK